MSKITSASQFIDIYNKERTSRDPLAVVARVTGSTVDLAVNTADLHKPLHVAVQIDETDRKKALDTLFEIFAFISKQAISLGQRVLPIDLGIAGFEVTKHPEFFAGHGVAQPRVRYGDHVQFLSNFPLKEPMITDQSHPKSRNMIDFKNLLSKALDKDKVRATINYQDEAIKTSYLDPKSKIDINFTVTNDTGTLVGEVQNELKTGESVMTMVGGTGFNVGLARNYNEITGQFESMSNLEIGHSKAPGTEAFYTPLDKVTMGDRLVPEKSFAAGHAHGELQGIKANVNYFRNYFDADSRKFKTESKAIDDYLHSMGLDRSEERVINSKLLKHSGPPNEIEIMSYAKEGDRLAFAMVTNLAKRWGAFLNSRLKQEFTDHKYTKLVITGSHVLDMLSIPAAKKVFMDSLLDGTKRKLNITEVTKNEMDGLQSLLRLRAHSLASTQAVA